MTPSAQTILLVEDEAEIADTLRYALTTEGMAVDWVARGDAALQAIAAASPSLIVLDVGLPDCSGFELLKNIRNRSDVPVMMLTARADEVDRIVGLEIGADDYVVKPFSPREVVARIKAILKRVGGNAAEPADFDIDRQAMRIRYRGTPLSLTRSEYLLLCILCSQRGRTFSRRQLIEGVWSSNHPSDDRAIDTHIKSLRAKLADVAPGESPIVTHRGFGYALAEPA